MIFNHTKKFSDISTKPIHRPSMPYLSKLLILPMSYHSSLCSDYNWMPLIPINRMYTVPSYSNLYSTPLLHMSSYNISLNMFTRPLSMFRMPTFLLPIPRPPNTMNTLVSSKKTAPPCTQPNGKIFGHLLNLE